MARLTQRMKQYEHETGKDARKADGSCSSAYLKWRKTKTIQPSQSIPNSPQILPSQIIVNPHPKMTRSTYQSDKDFYHGITSKMKYQIIADGSKQGVCLNLFEGFKGIQTSFDTAERLKIPIFIDNGSFERFTHWRKQNNPDQPVSKRLTDAQYFSRDNAFKFFSTIYEEMKKLLLQSKNPQNIIMTIPEVIAESKITQSLQLQYIPLIRELQMKYNFTPIVSLQFNPDGKEWLEEMHQSAHFIAKNIPRSWNWRIGIPFGNDFKIIQLGHQGGKQYGHVVEMFHTILKGYKAHLFACGTVEKIRLHGGHPFVKSCDASTLGFCSYSGHYITDDGKTIDPRALRQWIPEKREVSKSGVVKIKQGLQHCSLANAMKKRQILGDEGWAWEEWLSEKPVSNQYKNDPLISKNYSTRSDTIFKKGYTNEYFRFKVLLHDFREGLLNYFSTLQR